MAEYEGKREDDNCGHCKFWKEGVDTRKPDEGWCVKRPRLQQKHDDHTHRTNWCQFYERAKMAIPKDQNYRTTAQYENAEPEEVPSERPDDQTSAVVEELQVFHRELSQMEHQLAQQLVNAAVQDNTALMMETKGMVRIVTMLRQNVEKRIETLFPTVGVKQ